MVEEAGGALRLETPVERSPPTRGAACGVELGETLSRLLLGRR